MTNNVLKKVLGKFKREKMPVLFKRSKSQKVVFFLMFIFFALFAAGIIYTYLFAFNASLKLNGRAYMRDPVSLANPAAWGNYAKSFETLKVGEVGYWRLVFNSIWQTMGSIAISYTVVTMSSYVLSRYRFKGRNLIYGTYIVTMMLPIMGSGTSMYEFLSRLNIIDTPLMLITNISGLCNLYIYAFFKGIPQDYADAASVDGAGHVQIFLTIMLPQILPSLAILVISSFIGGWNDYSSGLIYYKENYPPLATAIYIYDQQSKYMANQPVFFAGALLAALPPVILFTLFQNTIMTKVYFGGLKG